MAGRAVSAVLLALSTAAAVWLSGPGAASAANSIPEATDVRLGGGEADTRFVMDLTRKIELHAFTLADPYRVVVDIPQVTFKLAPKPASPGAAWSRPSASA